LIGGIQVAKKKVMQEVEVDEPELQSKTKEQQAFLAVFGEQTEAHKSAYVTVKQLEDLVDLLANGPKTDDAGDETNEG
jgi:hypothetical protein